VLAVAQCQGLDWSEGGAVDVDGLILQVLPAADSDEEELADLTRELRAELLGLDAASVVPLAAEAPPEGAKGVDGTMAGWLAAQFGTLDGMRAVVAAVRAWASRTGRTVEVSIGGDVLKVTGVTSQQQGEIIDSWLARHGSGG
jgi:hypothetical protein